MIKQPGVQPWKGASAFRESLLYWSVTCVDLAGGYYGAPVSLQARNSLVAASATVTLAGTGAGTATATINGVAVANSSSNGTDALNAADLAAQINASVNA